MRDLPTATNAEAAEIGLAIQRVIRGENLDDINPDMANRYREYMHTIDRSAREWETDRQKFYEDSLEEGRMNRPTGRKLQDAIETGKKKIAFYRAQSRQKHADKRAWMEKQLRDGPKVEVYVEPNVVVGRIGDHPTTAVEGQMIRINGVQVYLKPGKNMTHPIIAERYEQIRRSKQETAERKSALSNYDSWRNVGRKMDKINREYGSTSGGGERGDSWLTPDVNQQF